MNSLWKSVSCLINKPSLLFTDSTISPLFNEFFPKRFKKTLQGLRSRRLNEMEFPRKCKSGPLGGKPLAKGLIIRTVVKKPRKPNSANRKCVVIKLSTGKEMTAFVPGIGHNLQEHQYVLCYNKNLKDVPGVKLRCVRGAYDLPHVIKKT